MDTLSETLLQITFKPYSPNGHIFFAGNAFDQATTDFLSVSLMERRVVLEFELGYSEAQPPHVTLRSDLLELNVWHTVFVYRERQSAMLIVNGVPYGPASFMGSSTHLNVQRTVSLGGPRNFSTLLPQITSRNITYFEGCISTLVVSHEVLKVCLSSSR